MGLTYTMKLSLPALPLLDPPRATGVLRREVGMEVFGIVEQVATEARQRTPVGVSGLLRASIGTRVTLGTDASTLVRGEIFTGAQAPYAVYVEMGTKPHWPPIAPLNLWAARVLGDARLAYAVAWAISRRGTRPRWMFRDAWALVRPTIPGRLRGAVARAAQALMAKG